MPKFYDVEHNSGDWAMLRAGRITSSEVKNIITPKTGKFSKGYSGYMERLLAEMVIQEPISTVGSIHQLERGHQLEPSARQEYEYLTGYKVESGGFITTDCGKIGASPDGRIVEQNGLVEFKCPYAQTHIGYALNKTLPDDYRPQLQCQMLVTGADWVDIYSYHPQIKGVQMRVLRDEKYIQTLRRYLNIFLYLMDRKCRKLIAEGYLIIEE